MRRYGAVRGLLKYLTSTACARNVTANSAPPPRRAPGEDEIRARRQKGEAEPDQLPHHRFPSGDDPGEALAEVGFVANRGRRDRRSSQHHADRAVGYGEREINGLCHPAHKVGLYGRRKKPTSIAVPSSRRAV
jgi:hypothetical protein